MNYYRRWIGDYVKKTAHLSLAEHGAYNVLLDVSYSTEKPLPGELNALCRLCRAITPEERAAVSSVADQFFPLCEDGLRRNPRASEEIGIAQGVIEKQRKSGVESAVQRWGPDVGGNGGTKLRRERVRAARERGTHTNAEWAAVLTACSGRCAKCGSPDQIVKDHILPIYAGGSDSIQNLQPLCRPCNSAKGSESVDYRPSGWVDLVNGAGSPAGSSHNLSTGSPLQPPTSNLQPPASILQPPTATPSALRARAHEKPGKVTQPGVIAASLRKLGCTVTPQNPVCQKWVEDGIELKRLEDSIAICRDRGKVGPIAASYLDSVVRDPANFTPGGKPGKFDPKAVNRAL